MKAPLQPAKLFGSASTKQLKGLKTIMDNRPQSGFQKPIQAIATKSQQVNKGIVLQRVLADAQEKAKAMQVPVPTSKEALINYLKNEPRTTANTGIDLLRIAFNKGAINSKDRINYDSIWPEVDPVAEKAKVWVEGFLCSIESDNVKSDKLFEHLNPMVQKLGGDIRGNSGSNMLYKFVFYNLFSKDIIDELFSSYSSEYAQALSEELSSKIVLHSGNGSSDEVFKEISLERMNELGEDTCKGFALETLCLGYKNLEESMNSKQCVEDIIEHYFLHDKGYLNAATKLTTKLIETYRKNRSAN